jgi:putative ribosome biogenesis GTPase RsgA
MKQSRFDFTKVDAALLPTVILVGRPNVGKSALFNRLDAPREGIQTFAVDSVRLQPPRARHFHEHLEAALESQTAPLAQAQTPFRMQLIMIF